MRKLCSVIFMMLFVSYNAGAYEPRRACAWSFTPKVGVSPLYFTSRTKTLNFSQVPEAAGLLSQIKIPRAADQFNTPWYVGGEIAHLLGNESSWEIFTDINYMQAQGKTIDFIENSSTVEQEFSPFKALGCYVGMRYYGDFNRRWFIPFGGAKIGFQHRAAVSTNQIANSDPTTLRIFDFYNAHNAVSASVQAGFDMMFCRFFALTFQAELLFSAPMKSNSVITVPPNPIVVVGNTGTIVAIPVSIGLKIII